MHKFHVLGTAESAVYLEQVVTTPWVESGHFLQVDICIEHFFVLFVGQVPWVLGARIQPCALDSVRFHSCVKADTSLSLVFVFRIVFLLYVG